MPCFSPFVPEALGLATLLASASTLVSSWGVSEFGTCDGSRAFCEGTELPSTFSWAPGSIVPSLALCDVVTAVFFGGVLGSAFSCVLLAELCVGRIILAKNPPSAGFEPAILVRAFVLGAAADGAGKDARGGFGRGCGAAADARSLLLRVERLLAVV